MENTLLSYHTMLLSGHRHRVNGSAGRQPGGDWDLELSEALTDIQSAGGSHAPRETEPIVFFNRLSLARTCGSSWEHVPSQPRPAPVWRQPS